MFVGVFYSYICLIWLLIMSYFDVVYNSYDVGSCLIHRVCGCMIWYDGWLLRMHARSTACKYANLVCCVDSVCVCMMYIGLHTHEWILVCVYVYNVGCRVCMYVVYVYVYVMIVYLVYLHRIAVMTLYGVVYIHRCICPCRYVWCLSVVMEYTHVYVYRICI